MMDNGHHFASMSGTSPARSAKQTGSAGQGMKAEPHITRETSMLNNVSSRIQGISSFVARQVQLTVQPRASSPSLVMGSRSPVPRFSQSHSYHAPSVQGHLHPSMPTYQSSSLGRNMGIGNAASSKGHWPVDGSKHGGHPTTAYGHNLSGTTLSPSPFPYGGSGGYPSTHTHPLPEGGQSPNLSKSESELFYGPAFAPSELLSRRPTVHHDGRRVLRARFQSLDQVAPLSVGNDAFVVTDEAGVNLSRKTFLLLGYVDGFHIWDVSDMNEIREVVSVREHGQVVDLQMVPEPIVGDHLVNGKTSSSSGMNLVDDAFATVRPLLALVSAPIEPRWNAAYPAPMLGLEEDHGSMSVRSSSGPERASLIIYSLRTNQAVRTLSDPRADVVNVECNRHVIVMSLSDGRIRVLANHDLSHIATFIDTLCADEHGAPIFSLGSRWIAYACSTQPPPTLDGTRDLASLSADQTGNTTTATVEKVARDVVQSVKSLGSIGYKAVTGYLASRSPSTSDTSSISGSRRSRDASSGNNHGSEVGGVIIVRDLLAEKQAACKASAQLASGHAHGDLLPPVRSVVADSGPGTLVVHEQEQASEDDHDHLSNAHSQKDYDVFVSGVGSRAKGNRSRSSTRSAGLSPYGENGRVAPILHFRAHEHPCSAMSFDRSGFRLVTVSSRGDTFRVHSVARGRAELLFTLSRGYTGAIINDLSFDYESSWLGVSTGRGTTHIFRLPHLEIHQSQSASRTHSTMGWAYRRPTSEKTWTPVVRIRQKPDNESVDDDITLLDYPDLGVATNGGSGYMPYGYPGGYSPNSAEHAGSFDVVSMWSNSMLVNELTTSSPVPAALASRFVRFGPNRDRAVFVFNSSGLLTLHRLRPSKGKYLLKLAHRILARFGADRPILGSEFSMEADEIAEWRLARGEDWDDVCRPFQFMRPVPTSPVSTSTDTSSSTDTEQSSSPSVCDVELASTELTADPRPNPAPKPEKPLGKKAKRRSRASTRATLPIPESTSKTTLDNATTHQSTKNTVKAPTKPSTEARWLAHAEIVTYSPTLARTLWNKPGFQFQVLPADARGDGGDISAAKPIDVNHPLPTPYGWARAENHGAAGSDLEECIRKAMHTNLDLSPASQELLRAQAEATTHDPFVHLNPNAQPALMQEQFDDDIRDCIRDYDDDTTHLHEDDALPRRSPLLTPEDLDQDTIDDLDHRKRSRSISSHMDNVAFTDLSDTADMTGSHLRVPNMNSRSSTISIRQSDQGSTYLASDQRSSTSLISLEDVVREISLDDDEDQQQQNSSSIVGSMAASSSRILGSIFRFDD